MRSGTWSYRLTAGCWPVAVRIGRCGCGRPVPDSWWRPCRATPVRSGAWRSPLPANSWPAVALRGRCGCGRAAPDGYCRPSGVTPARSGAWRSRLIASWWPVVERMEPCGLGSPHGAASAALQGYTGGVHGVALSADGRLLVSGGFDGAGSVWETSSATRLHTLRSHAAASA